MIDKTERLEAIGSRGEAIVIVRTWSAASTPTNMGDLADSRGAPSYRLATGERLNPTADPAVFETQDRSRLYTLR